MHHAHRLGLGLRSGLGGLILACVAYGAVAAEGAYPSRPIRLIVPFVAGGPSDTLGRLVGQKLSEATGQSVIIDNRGSAGGMVGMELGAKAAPDGYTLLLGAGGALTINQSLYEKLPYDPQRDYQAVTQLDTGPNVMSVHPSVAAKSVQEFIALARAKPGQINFASAGTGNRLASELFKVAAGVDIVNISYKGTGQALTELLGGQVQMMMINIIIAAPQVKGGKLRGLGVTSLARNPSLPELPTLAESGLPGFESVSWHCILLPAGTPRAIVTRLHGELVKILAQPDVRERLSSRGLTPVGSTPQELSTYVRNESVKYAKLIKQVGIKPE
jgi:tripartite-type tricarboxylate transporter receptor subunit TctC